MNLPLVASMMLVLYVSFYRLCIRDLQRRVQFSTETNCTSQIAKLHVESNAVSSLDILKIMDVFAMEHTSTKELYEEKDSDADECFYEVLEQLEELSRDTKDVAKNLVQKFKSCRARPNLSRSSRCVVWVPGMGHFQCR